MSTTVRLTAVTVALLAIAGCHGSHGYDLTLGPYLTLTDAGPDSATVSWAAGFDGFWSDPAPVLLELWRWEEGDHKFRKLVELAPDTTTWTDLTLDAELDYEYILYAFFEKGPKKDSVTLEAPAGARGAIPASLSLPAGPGEVPWFGRLPGEPRLSPDGATVAYVEGGRLFLLDVVSGRSTPAPFEGRGPVAGVAFLPDGEGLVVAAGPAGREDLWRLGRDGVEIAGLTAGGAGASDPDAAPDGTGAVFVRGGTLWSLDFTSSAAHPLPEGPGGRPRWSPDGSALAFLRPGPAGFDVVLGGPPERVLAGDASGEGPLVWAPDGRSVWYRSAGGGTHRIFLNGGAR